MCHQIKMGKIFRAALLALAVLAISMTFWRAVAAEGSADRGERVFSACAACHSLEPKRNMTGPSLAELWNRKAGSLTSFPRYSSPLQSSGIVWNDKTLDDWIKDPQHLIPGNDMTFQGINNNQQRADLLAFLKQATQAGHAPSQSAQRGGQMGGMMGGSDLNLKTVGPERRVQAISYCRDTYRVTTADGHTRAFWERNLRLMTDSSENGPEKGAPALVPAGMMGDRADAIFATPEEINSFIKPQC
jgi:cytochrome c